MRALHDNNIRWIDLSYSILTTISTEDLRTSTEKASQLFSEPAYHRQMQSITTGSRKDNIGRGTILVLDWVLFNSLIFFYLFVQFLFPLFCQLSTKNQCWCESLVFLKYLVGSLSKCSIDFKISSMSVRLRFLNSCEFRSLRFAVNVWSGSVNETRTALCRAATGHNKKIIRVLLISEYYS